MIGLPLVIISYALLLLFLIAFFIRTRNMAKLPHHLRWELSPVPHEKGKGHYGGSYLEEFEWWTKTREKSLIAEIMYMMKEIFFLKGVHENNKKLWYFSFPFHFGMYIIGAMIGFIILNTILINIGITQTKNILDSAIVICALAGYILGGLGTIGLILRRVFDPDLKNFNTGGTYFNLLLLLAVFVTGIFSAMNTQIFSNEMMEYVNALLTADTSLALSGITTIHCVLGLVFFAYLPFTKMMHFMAKYFTYHEVRWNDAPMSGDKRMEKEVKELLSQPVTWAAPHLKADGKKNWVDIATEETKS